MDYKGASNVDKGWTAMQFDIFQVKILALIARQIFLTFV
jgi:hypothetical protein